MSKMKMIDGTYMLTWPLAKRYIEVGWVSYVHAVEDPEDGLWKLYFGLCDPDSTGVEAEDIPVVMRAGDGFDRPEYKTWASLDKLRANLRAAGHTRLLNVSFLDV